LAENLSLEKTDLNERHLTEGELAVLLDYLRQADTVIVGGQSLALWARYYLRRMPQIARAYSMSSEDLDLYGPPTAADVLAENLIDAKVYKPDFGDASPNTATVTGKLGRKTIQVDFLKDILGVDHRSISNNAVTLQSAPEGNGRTLQIKLLHPLDCLRSRFSNINDLKRSDPHSVSSARASVLVVQAFVDELLEQNQTRKALAVLSALHFVIRDGHLGKRTDIDHRLDPISVLLNFRLDPRLDSRWRKNQLASSIRRLHQKAAAVRKRPASTPHTKTAQ